MRIQHNIMAMNAYRNFSNNTSALSKNLEKLSSGYKINRAGDDAAGLAISEKMRAQITGLNRAQANAKSGINLVQTAEGAMQEIHSMLNRMVDLADQSANGTYDDKVDRVQLQKEVSQLRDEIDRIADASNFNGIKLLDGSLSAAGASGAAGAAGAVNLETELNGAELTVKDVAATKGDYTLTALTDGQIKDGETLKLTFNLSDGTMKEIQLTAKDFTDGTAGGELIGEDGTVYGKYAAGGATGPTENELRDAFIKSLKESDLAADFKISTTGTDGEIKLTNIAAGADAPQIMQNVNVKKIDKDGAVTETTNAVTQNKGEDAYQTIDASQFALYDGNDSSVLNINGKKFAILVQDGTDATDTLMKKAMDNGLELIMVANPAVDDAGTLADDLVLGDADNEKSADVAAELSDAIDAQGNSIAVALGKALGYNVSFEAAADEDADDESVLEVAAKFVFKKDTSINPEAKAGSGLRLQIGDTSDDFNQLTVSIDDMHAKSLGLTGVDISSQDGAAAAVTAIKDAINKVSDTRGTLGATQNRLDHTINNLSVMEENIQDAESTIRDTDVADEMMAYTKNNILIQSAQAMLAQANQVPQGVLQLLQ